MNRQDLIDQLEETATLLRLSGANDFKAGAYEKAARLFESPSINLEQHIAENTLDSLKGVGKSLAADIMAWAQEGQLPKLLGLREEVPEGLQQWLTISGLGAKRAYKIHKELGITTLEELEARCRDGSVADLAGMGEKSAAKLLKSLEWKRQHADRCLVHEAEELASLFLQALQECKGIEYISTAGSLRRACETIGDIDILIAASEKAAPAIMDTAVHLPSVREILGQGPTKSSVRCEGGRQVDIRIVKPEQFGPALMYFTGSKEHNITLRQRAKDRGMALNEYGLYQLGDEGTDFDQPICTGSEEEIYTALELPYVLPERREGLFDPAHETARPLVEVADIQGIIHAHSTWSDGKASIEEMARACIEKGYRYLGLTDHSRTASYAGGLTIDRVKAQWEDVDQLNQRFKDEGLDFVVFKGIESDILGDGALDYPDDILAGFDFVIGSVHSQLDMDPVKMQDRLVAAVSHPHCHMLGHPTTRLLLKREGNKVDMVPVIKAAAAHNTAIEMNANPHRLELDWHWGDLAKELRLCTSINPDAHRIEQIEFVKYGVGIARKAGFERARVLNTLDPKQFLKALR